MLWLMWQIQDKAESPNEPFILLSVFGQPSGSGSGPFDDIIDDVISRFPERSKVTKFKPHPLTASKRNFFAESIDKIDEAVDAVGSDAGNGTKNGKISCVKNQTLFFPEIKNLSWKFEFFAYSSFNHNIKGSWYHCAAIERPSYLSQ